MQVKYILATTVLALLFLSSCAETGYDGSTRARPVENKIVTPPAPQAAQRGQPIDTGVISGLPVLSFVETEVEMDGQLEARLEVQLSKASTTPITAVVNLENGTAIHYTDFQGFKLESKIAYSRNTAETRQTIVIPPGTTRMALPVIGGTTTYNCDSYFYAKLNPMNIQGAQINDDTAKILVPCEFARPRDSRPPPRVEQPIPAPSQPAPRIEEPCPPPRVQAPVNVRWAQEFVKKSEDSKRVVMKLEIDQRSTLPVTISVATVNGSAKAGRDFHPVNFNVTIPAGAKSVSFPVELITGDLCAQPGEREHDVRFEFSVVATRILNGNMQQPEARVSVKREFDNDGACRLAPAPSAPAPSQPAPRAH